MSGPDAVGWILEPHVCRHCFGRVARRDRTFRCTSCGAQAQDAARGICGCGIRPQIRMKTGFRCAPNPARGPNSPAEFVITFDGRNVDDPNV